MTPELISTGTRLINIHVQYEDILQFVYNL